VIFGRKGSTGGTAKIFRAAASEPALIVTETIAGRYTSGVMTSALIGPAQHWDKLIFQTAEKEPADTVSISIVGISAEGQEDTLKLAASSGEDLSFIDAQAYPFLKILFQTGDDINLTPVQLRKWLVLYETVPEGVVFYRGPSDLQVVSEGETFSAEFGFTNVSDKVFPDSLAVRYDFLNEHQGARLPLLKKIASPAPWDTTVFSLAFNTVSKQGLNDVEVFVNPRLEKEESYDNNVLVLPRHVEVLTDVHRPVLEVTVDSRVIGNMEFVQPDPEIAIRLWDDNKFLLKADTSGVDVFLAGPCASAPCDFRRISFSDPNVRWASATSDRPFTTTVSLHGLADGTYTLRVNAGDANGNAAADDPYEISFRVQRAFTIVSAPPYPNPFYLHVCFEITVSGDLQAFAGYQLQIYTLKGLLVREFSADGSGLHVGTNRIIWDGVDSGGASLPNGVYLYRLVLTTAATKSTSVGRIMLLR
jgi:hypothetical protein